MVVALLGAQISARDGVTLIEQRTLFHPSRESVGTPADHNLSFADSWFGPDRQLHGWWVPGTSGITILWMHGNGGNIGHRLERLKRLHRGLDANFFLFSYRGYGQSPGRPSEDGMIEDARAALAYLRSRPDVDAERIVYYGKSLGGGPAVQLAVEQPPHRLILQSTFTSLWDVARWHVPLLPEQSLFRTRFPNAERIGQVRSPVLIAHGDRDRTVPVEHAGRLYAAAAEPRVLVIIAGADHEDFDTRGAGDDKAYLNVLRRFIASAVAREHRAGAAPTGSPGSALRPYQASIVAVRPQLCRRSRYSSASSSGHAVTTAFPLLWASSMILTAAVMPSPGTERVRERTTWSIELWSSLCRTTLYGSRARGLDRGCCSSSGVVSGRGSGIVSGRGMVVGLLGVTIAPPLYPL